MSEKLIYLNEVDSTNLYVKNNSFQLPDGVLVCADAQSAGRGRRGRQWVSPAGVNIYASLHIKNPQSLYLTGSLIGLAGLELFRILAPEADFYIKWPNDVYVGTAKIAGILCESCDIKNGHINAVAAGIGLNINLEPEVLSQIERKAASLKSVTGKTFELKAAAGLLSELADKYYRLYREAPQQLHELWKKENRLINRDVELLDSLNQPVYGRCCDLDDDGAIILNVAGELKKFYCGDVSVKRF